ncbi:MAG: transposase [Proteobacteria bacterium]|nr:MAG: transposase [Pseudomonadota bacterium]
MSKVCRIVQSLNINRRKYSELCEQARLMGHIRKETWQRFGSINSSGIDFRVVRNDWVKTRDFAPLPAKAWKETLRDTLDDVFMHEQTAKLKVREAVFKRIKDPAKQRELFRLLKGEGWKAHSFLRRKMRKFRKHGQTSVANQIILETGVYAQFKGLDGNTWLKVPTFERGRRLVIPLNAKTTLSGCLRLILKDGTVFVHYTIQQKTFKPCGTETLGVDKGYTEAFVDSAGRFYGCDFGKVMTEGTQKRHVRGKARNKLHQIEKKKFKKSRHIKRYNLGRKKLDRHNSLQKKRIEGIAFQSAHAIVDHAKTVIAEDLTKPFSTRTKWKTYNRTMSAWAKGALADALESVTKARGSCLRVVNAAHTSQMDSKSGHLEGRRDGDKFYHTNGEVSSSDINAAINIKRRADDTEIRLYTPHKRVKKILLDRLMANGGVNPAKDDRPSRTPVARRKRTSTESELGGNLA